MELNSSPPTLNPVDLRASRSHLVPLRDYLQFCVTAIVVIALTAGVNAMASPTRLFLWVVLGFAIAMGFAALETFGRDLWLGRMWLGRVWQERKMREFLARQAR